mmetsp:Transcript_13187/g.30034  ORF Transcript_13187/g.30034 Transcript_13187/m.30034 type:complete len:104 (+) Transcript_13187:67-378(+)
MARRGSSCILSLALMALVVYSMMPASTFVGFRAPLTGQTQALRLTSVQTQTGTVAMQAAPGGGAGGAPTRINLAFLGFVAGMAVLGLLGAFFYGSYVGLGSSL